LTLVYVHECRILLTHSDVYQILSYRFRVYVLTTALLLG